MRRRGFLAALAAVPFVGAFAREVRASPETTVMHDRWCPLENCYLLTDANGPGKNALIMPIGAVPVRMFIVPCSVAVAAFESCRVRFT